MNDFTEVMSKRTDSELIEITTVLRDSYQPEAVTAAEAELKKRNLTEQQLSDAQQQLANKKQDEEKKNGKIEILKRKTVGFADTFHPMAQESTDKAIKIVTIGLTIGFLVYLINNRELTVLMLQDIGDADFSVLEYFAPLILFPIGLIGFWKTKKYGWIILTVLLTYLMVTNLIALGLEIKYAIRPPFQFDNSGLIQMQEVENSFPDELFGKRIAFNIGQFLLSTGLLIFLNRRTITERYLISKRTQLLVVGLAAAPFIFFGLAILV